MKIALLRKEKGITQAELASTCGTTQQQVAKIEGGVVDPRLSTLRAIAIALGCELKDLFFTREEFLSEVRGVARAHRLDLSKIKLVALNQLCLKERHIPTFEPFWEEIEIANGNLRYREGRHGK